MNENLNLNNPQNTLRQKVLSLLAKGKAFIVRLKTKFIENLKIIRSKITKKVLIGFILFVLAVIIVAFLLAWLHFKTTSPEQIAQFIENIDFNFYVLVMLILLTLFFLVNLVFIIKKSTNKKLWLACSAAILGSIFAVFLLSYVSIHPRLQYNYPEGESNMLDYTRPVEIMFNLPMQTAKLKPSVTPEFIGKWEWEPYLGIDGLTRKGKFYPTITAYPESRFVVYVAGVSKILDAKEHEYGFIFHTPKLPNLLSTYPTDEAENIQIREAILMQFDKSSQELVDWDFKVEPELEFITEFKDDLVILVPTESYNQSETYTVNASFRPKRMNLETNEDIEYGEFTEVTQFSFSTVKEPLIDSLKPGGTGVLIDQKITVEFEEDMDRNSVEQSFSIDPEIEGTIIWETDRKFVFEPDEDLEKAKKYVVKFSSGLQSLNGGVTEKEITHEFTTIGRIKVSEISPANGSGGVSEFSEIRVKFDQQVERQSAQEHFSISPGINGSFSWDKNTMIFKPSAALAFQTTYEVKVRAGIQSVHGLSNKDEYVSRFTIRSNMVLFNVPIFFQSTSFSCNIFTARMVLAWKGISSDHVSLISEIGYNPNQSGGNWTGNPYKEFIGNADGSWGYGVYHPPIQKILSNRGVQSQVHSNWNVRELARALDKRHAVIVWRYNGVGGGQNISWTASDGTYIHAFNGMHGSVISGYIGSPDNPTSFYVNDPWLGQFWMNTGTLDAYWSYSGRVALEVF